MSNKNRTFQSSIIERMMQPEEYAEFQRRYESEPRKTFTAGSRPINPIAVSAVDSFLTGTTTWEQYVETLGTVYAWDNRNKAQKESSALMLIGKVSRKKIAEREQA